MPTVLKICVAEKSGVNMQDKLSIEVIANKGIINDRYFSENNQKDLQITLIESENIDYYNKISSSNLPIEGENFVVTATRPLQWKSISTFFQLGKTFFICFSIFFDFIFDDCSLPIKSHIEPNKKRLT